MSTVAIIPARGGSKRIPHKNVIDFMGKPMIAWTIESALQSNIFDKVYVSTDDFEIATTAIYYGADFILREGYSDDQTTVQQATIHTLKEIKKKRNESYDIVVQLMACCPLRTSRCIQESYWWFTHAKTDFQLSCVEFDFMNPWWAVKLNDGVPTPLFPKALKMRSQDLEKLYCVTGAIWIANVEALYKQGTFYGEGYQMKPLPFIHSIDIDDYKDLKLAESLYIGGKENNEF
jgi:CMP-N-acetylneuraminic acid synthetase